MPHVTLIASQSIDGFITKHDVPGTGFCSEEDQIRFLENLRAFDCMIMGRATYHVSRNDIMRAKHGRRLRKIMTRDPRRWAIDTYEDSIEFTSETPTSILRELDDRGYNRCALLGGSEIYTEFLKNDLVDELLITIEPHTFGSGARLVDGKTENRFELASIDKLNANTALLRYNRRLI